MQPQSGIKTWQWVVTVVVIVILIIIGIWVFGNKGSSAPVEVTPVVTDNSSTPTAINRIVMSDQYPGNVVYLNSAQFSNPGWVVIQDDNAGTPGKILGQTYFVAGSPLPGRITLSAPMIDGGTYYAVMYSDNGDQKFTAADSTIKDVNRNVIMKVFHASEAVSSQIKG